MDMGYDVSDRTRETLDSSLSGFPCECGSTLKLPLVSMMTDPTWLMLAIPFDRAIWSTSSRLTRCRFIASSTKASLW